MLTIREEVIVSSTDIVRDFKKCREKVKEFSHLIVFKNNTPDLAVVDYKEYKRLIEIANFLDDIDIARMVEERDKRDSGKRHTLEEVRAKRAKIKSKANQERHL